MTARSTRNKMKWQAKKVIDSLEKCQEHFKLLNDLSGGESPYIEKHVPPLVTALEMMRQMIKTFREGL